MAERGDDETLAEARRLTLDMIDAAAVIEDAGRSADHRAMARAVTLSRSADFHAGRAEAIGDVTKIH